MSLAKPRRRVRYADDVQALSELGVNVEKMLALAPDQTRRHLARAAELGPDGPRAAGSPPGYTLSSGAAIALVAATAKTVLNAIAPAAFGITIVEFGIGFDGITGAAAPVLVELVQSTQATAGTVGSTPVGVQTRGRASAVGFTGGAGYTVEPTVLTVIKQWLIDPYKGQFVIVNPDFSSPETDTSAGTIKALGLRCTAPAAVNTRAYMEIERV